MLPYTVNKIIVVMFYIFFLNLDMLIAIRYYKIIEPVRGLSLVDRSVWMRVCKHGCDVLYSRIF